MTNATVGGGGVPPEKKVVWRGGGDHREHLDITIHISELIYSIF